MTGGEPKLLQRLENFKTDYSVLVFQADEFLKKGTPIDEPALRKGSEAAGELRFNDEDGRMFERDAIYDARKQTSLTEAALRRMEKLYPALWEAQNRLGDMTTFQSNTLPTTLKRKIVQKEIEVLKEIDAQWKTFQRDLEPAHQEEVESFVAIVRGTLADIRRKIIPYNSADQTVASNHLDEYKKLRYEIQRLGGWNTVKSVDIPSMTQKILCDLYPEEFQAELQRYSENPALEPDRQKVNEMITFSNAVQSSAKK